MDRDVPIPDVEWFCPLLNGRSAEGYCLDINYQRQGFFKADILTEVLQHLQVEVERVSAACEQCPNQPLTGDSATEIEHIPTPFDA